MTEERAQALDTDEISLDWLRAVGAVPDDYAAVLLTGSLARGWGHANSDFDVYVIAEKVPPPPPGAFYAEPVRRGRIPRLSIYADDRRADVEFWRESIVEALLAKVAALADNGYAGAGGNLEEFEIRALDHLTIARQLSPGDWLAGIQRRIRASALLKVVAAHYFERADNLLDDAAGTLRSGDETSAVLAAHAAYGNTVDGLLAYHGELAASAKWRARKMERANPPELSWDAYWELETMAGLAAAGPGPWVRRVAHRCREIIGGVEVT